MKAKVLFFLFLVVWSAAKAQNISVRGDVINGIIHEGVPEAVATLLRASDSTVLARDTTQWQFNRDIGSGGNSRQYIDRTSGTVFAMKVPRMKEIILQVEAKGFEPYLRYIDVEREAKRGIINLGSLYLYPTMKENTLNEVTVSATKIKMYYRGDTLIYNADAFDVKQSETLRKLVEQLPGTEFKDGVIYVNGRKVDNLLLSGKNFFNGNIGMMLDNLPAYIASKIKVYDKAGEMSELTGRDMHDKEFVMDVHLKREYTGVWLAKLRGDIGTRETWGAQGFLMRFDERQMFSLTTDVNNLNQQRRMSDNTTSSHDMPQGRTQRNFARLDYYFEPNKSLRFTANVQGTHNNKKVRSWTNTETFLETGSMMERAESQSRDKDTRIEGTLSVRARKQKHWQHTLSYNIAYGDIQRRSDMQRVTYLWNDGADTLNTLLSPYMSNGTTSKHNPTLNSMFTLGDDILNAKLDFSHNKSTFRSFNNYNLTYYNGDAPDRRRRFIHNANLHSRASASVDFVHRYERIDRFDGTLTPYLRYTHSHGNLSHPEYRLERMAEWSERMEWGMGSLGILPEGDWRAECLDIANSYYTLQDDDEAEGGMKLSHKIKTEKGNTWEMSANASLSYTHRDMHYTRSQQEQTVRHNALFFTPTVSLKWKQPRSRTWQSEAGIRYDTRGRTPMLTQLLTLRDQADPLNISLGNASLRNAYAHNTSLNYTVRYRKGQRISLGSSYQRTHNDIGTASHYDIQSGVRTYRPVNSNRTHSAHGSVYLFTPLDAKKHFSVNAGASFNYAQNTQLSSTSARASQGLLRVLSPEAEIGLHAKASKWLNINCSSKTSWKKMRQPGMHRDYRETTLSASANAQLPWDIYLDVKSQTRLLHGSISSSQRSAFTSINATLQRAFLDGKLGIILTGCDLLNQNTTFISLVSDVARTERYTNVLGRYFLLSATYHLNWQKKRK